jgi:hypothetical protein
MAGSPFIAPGGKHLAEKGRLGFDPFEKNQFLYIMFPPFVKAPAIADFGLRIVNFWPSRFSIPNPQSPIRNFLIPLPIPPFFVRLLKGYVSFCPPTGSHR